MPPQRLLVCALASADWCPKDLHIKRIGFQSALKVVGATASTLPATASVTDIVAACMPKFKDLVRPVGAYEAVVTSRTVDDHDEGVIAQLLDMESTAPLAPAPAHAPAGGNADWLFGTLVVRRGAPCCGVHPSTLLPAG